MSEHLLQQAQDALWRESDREERLRVARIKDLGGDVVDMVRRVTAHANDSFYAQEKARAGLRAMVNLWVATVGDVDASWELERSSDELHDAVGRAFDAVQRAREGSI